MADEKPIPVSRQYQMDQAVSINSFWEATVGEEVVKLQITSRNGSSVEDIVRVTMDHVEALAKLRQSYPKPEHVAGEPVRVAVDDSGNEVQEPKVFTASEMVVDLHEGKIFTKVKGKPFEKFGVAIWPEVLEACGIKVVIGEPVPDVAGWTAKYIEKDGKDGKRVPSKVIALLPPKKS